MISFIYIMKWLFLWESRPCELHFDMCFKKFEQFQPFLSLLKRKKLKKISDMPPFDLDKNLIECALHDCKIIGNIIWIATH